MTFLSISLNTSRVLNSLPSFTRQSPSKNKATILGNKSRGLNSPRSFARQSPSQNKAAALGRGITNAINSQAPNKKPNRTPAISAQKLKPSVFSSSIAPVPPSVNKEQPSVNQAQLPVDQAQLPVNQAQLPVDQAQLPVDQAQLPVDQAQLPVNQAQLPVNQAQSPVNQDLPPVPAKPEETSNKKVDEPKPSLVKKTLTTRNIAIMGVLGGTAAVAPAFAALSAKVGVLAASQILIGKMFMFLEPGLLIVSFLLKTAFSLALSLTLPIILPILSAIVVTVIIVAISLYVAHLFMNKIQNTITKVFTYIFTHMQNAAVEGSQRILGQVPGYAIFSSLFGSKETVASRHSPAEIARQEE
jgi:hypothetical protein